MHVAESCMFMTDATRERTPKGRAAQSCAGPTAACRSTLRCGRAPGAGLLYFAASSLPLPRAGSATEGASPSHRSQIGVYRQTSTQPDSAGPSVRCHQTIVHQRGSQPGIARPAPTRARAWVSRDQIGPGPVVSFGISTRSLAAGKTGASLPVAGARETAAGARKHGGCGITGARYGDKR